MAVEPDVVEVVLPNGVTALVRVTDTGRGEMEPGPAAKVGAWDAFSFDNVSGMLEGIAESVRRSLARAKPSRTMVELGIDIAIRNGKLTGLLAEGGGKASLHVTLEWAAEVGAGRGGEPGVSPAVDE